MAIDEVNPDFIKWADANSVDMTYEEDWLPWFKCWADGYNHGVEVVKQIIRET